MPDAALDLPLPWFMQLGTGLLRRHGSGRLCSRPPGSEEPETGQAPSLPPPPSLLGLPHPFHFPLLGSVCFFALQHSARRPHHRTFGERSHGEWRGRGWRGRGRARPLLPTRNMTAVAVFGLSPTLCITRIVYITPLRNKAPLGPCGECGCHMEAGPPESHPVPRSD